MNQHQEITACAFIYSDEGKLFVAKRAATKSFLPNKFELVGGHTEFGETLQQSIIREVREELEIDVVVEEPFHAFTYLSNNDSIHTVEVDYFAKLADKNQVITLHPEDHSEYQWIIEDEVDNYFDKNDEERTAILVGFSALKKKYM